MKQNGRKRIRASIAANMLGCSAKTIKRNPFGFQLFKLNPDIPNSPTLVYEAEVKNYLERTTK